MGRYSDAFYQGAQVGDSLVRNFQNTRELMRKRREEEEANAEIAAAAQAQQSLIDKITAQQEKLRTYERDRSAGYQVDSQEEDLDELNLARYQGDIAQLFANQAFKLQGSPNPLVRQHALQLFNMSMQSGNAVAEWKARKLQFKAQEMKAQADIQETARGMSRDAMAADLQQRQQGLDDRKLKLEERDMDLREQGQLSPEQAMATYQATVRAVDRGFMTTEQGNEALKGTPYKLKEGAKPGAFEKDINDQLKKVQDYLELETDPQRIAVAKELEQKLIEKGKRAKFNSIQMDLEELNNPKTPYQKFIRGIAGFIGDPIGDVNRALGGEEGDQDLSKFGPGPAGDQLWPARQPATRPANEDGGFYQRGPGDEGPMPDQEPDEDEDDGALHSGNPYPEGRPSDRHQEPTQAGVGQNISAMLPSREELQAVMDMIAGGVKAKGVVKREDMNTDEQVAPEGRDKNVSRVLAALSKLQDLEGVLAREGNQRLPAEQRDPDDRSRNTVQPPRGPVKYTPGPTGPKTAEERFGPMPARRSGREALMTPTTPSKPFKWEEVEKHSDTVEKASRDYGVPSNLIKAVMAAESGGRAKTPNSSKGAEGLMQLMPATAKDMGVKNTKDPEQNIRGGTKYLAMLLKRYKGNLPKVLAAYNWGMGNLDKLGLVKAPQETREYIQRVQEAIQEFAQSEKGRAEA